ncbi:MAG: hypothetical protein HRT98_03480 [Mycoplasmatales bacterium]|nr:hypothetical protein [Mycoplasmatales bacterium]
MKKKNKVVLSMGTIAAVVIPTTIVAAGIGSKTNSINNIKENSLYTGYSKSLNLFSGTVGENARPLLQGTNKSITSGFKGQLFEDSRGNLWALSNKNPLQVLRHDALEWKDAEHGSQVTNGSYGQIYEDSKGDLWVISSSGIQVLRVSEGKTEWETQFEGNQITNGEGGQILEDSEGNMWAIANYHSLQVLRKGSTRWMVAADGNELLNNNFHSKLFKDSKGNLWAMSFNHQLQVLRKNNTRWEKAGRYGRHITPDNTTASGFNANGKIFEDSKGNLWVGGSNYPLEVLRAGEVTWEIVGGSNPIITNSDGLLIDEDSKGNLWAAGSNSRLLTLKNGEQIWAYAGHGSAVYGGESGEIVEDDFGNLWIMGGSTALQVLRHDKEKWEYAGNGNNIENFNVGCIFKDSKGNLWTMGRDTALQVLRKGSEKWVDREAEKKVVSLANEEQKNIKNKLFPGGIQDASNKAKFSRKTAAEIKALVENDPKQLKNILNIDILNLGSHTKVKSMEILTEDGGMNFKFEISTISASNPIQSFEAKVTTLTEKQILDSANSKIQNKEQSFVESKIKNFDTTQVSKNAKATKKKAVDIVRSINDDIFKLKQILGLDVNDFIKGTTSAINKIKLTSKDGEIQLSVTVYTPGVTQQYINVPVAAAIETMTNKEVDEYNKKTNWGGIIGGTLAGLIILGGISIVLYKVGKQIQKRRRDKFQNKLDSNIKIKR